VNAKAIVTQTHTHTNIHSQMYIYIYIYKRVAIVKFSFILHAFRRVVEIKFMHSLQLPPNRFRCLLVFFCGTYTRNKKQTIRLSVRLSVCLSTGVCPFVTGRV